jgi:hypothetical protein
LSKLSTVLKTTSHNLSTPFIYNLAKHLANSLLLEHTHTPSHITAGSLLDAAYSYYDKVVDLFTILSSFSQGYNAVFLPVQCVCNIDSLPQELHCEGCEFVVLAELITMTD